MTGSITDLERQLEVSLRSLAGSTNAVDTRVETTVRARRDFDQLAAACLERALNEWMAAQPCDTLDQKRHVAQTVTTALRSLGMAIQDERTGAPTLLHVVSGSFGENGSFQLRVIGDAKGARVRTSVKMFPIRVIPFRSSDRHLAGLYGWMASKAR